MIFMKTLKISVVNNRTITIFKILLFIPNHSFHFINKDNLKNKRLTNLVSLMLQLIFTFGFIIYEDDLSGNKNKDTTSITLKVYYTLNYTRMKIIPDYFRPSCSHHLFALSSNIGSYIIIA